jgi:nitrate/nitrite transport system ATP-binding protein
MSLVELDQVSKSFGSGTGRTPVLAGVSLSVEAGEFVAVVGPSGAGKTTLVNLVAGLARPDSGTVVFDGRPVLGPSAERGVVFQTYALLPWFTVRQNVLLGVGQAHPSLTWGERRAHADRYIEMVNLAGAAGKRPPELSGGMRQRVAVARALAMNPRLLLLDEPLGALDALTRGALQDEFVNIWQREGTAMVLVTNDPEEALLTADRVIPLMPGPPARPGEEIRVPFARPRRDPEVRESAAFVELKHEIAGRLRSGIAAARAAGKAVPYPDLSRPNKPPLDPRSWRARLKRAVFEHDHRSKDSGEAA